jgi:hypothetical protein
VKKQNTKVTKENKNKNKKMKIKTNKQRNKKDMLWDASHKH